MRPRDPQKAETIRRKALEMLVLEGFDAFSMQKLAKAARVSPATLYIHFKDRDDLIYQLWQEQVTAWTALMLAEFDPEASFEKNLWRQWTKRTRFFQAHPLEWQFMQQVRHSALHAKYLDHMPPAFSDALAAFVTRAIERGELTDFGLGKVRREDFAWDLLWALMYGPLYAMLRWVPDRSKPLEESPARVDMEGIAKLFACVVKGLRP